MWELAGYLKHISRSRKILFFVFLYVEIKKVFKIVLNYGLKASRDNLLKKITLSRASLTKIVLKLTGLMTSPDFSTNKLGGLRKAVQVDETILNFKVKSNRDRSPGNRTDSSCIVQYDRQITRCFAQIIPDKKESTIVPIIALRLQVEV